MQFALAAIGTAVALQAPYLKPGAFVLVGRLSDELTCLASFSKRRFKMEKTMTVKTATSTKTAAAKTTKKPAKTNKVLTVAEYSADIAKFTKTPNEKAISKIINYCGIALRSSADAACVASSDKSELNRIRDGFAKKKLGLDEASAADGLKKVCVAMKGVRRKKRVTFLYLLAEVTGTLGKLG